MKISTLLRYGHTASEYQQCRPQITRHNMWATRALSSCFAFIISAFTIMSALGINPQWLPVYAVTVVVFVLPFFLSRNERLGERFAVPLAILTSSGLLGFGIIASVADPTMVATVFHVLMIMVAIFYIANMAFMTILLTGGAVCLIISSFMVKPVNLASGDAYNVVIFLVVALVFHALVQGERINGFLVTDELRRARRELAIESHFDALSGLYNRGRFFTMVDRLPITPEHTVVLLDIDNFKQINDNYGHNAGDKVIAQLGAAMRTALGLKGRQGEDAGIEMPEGRQTFAGRLGGDEFIMFIGPDGPDPYAAVAEVEKIMAETDFGDFTGVGISAGFASARKYPGVGVDKLYKIADVTMYEEKDAHHSQIRGRERK